MSNNISSRKLKKDYRYLLVVIDVARKYDKITALATNKNPEHLRRMIKYPRFRNGTPEIWDLKREEIWWSP